MSGRERQLPARGLSYSLAGAAILTALILLLPLPGTADLAPAARIVAYALVFVTILQADLVLFPSQAALDCMIRVLIMRRYSRAGMLPWQGVDPWGVGTSSLESLGRDGSVTDYVDVWFGLRRLNVFRQGMF